MQMPSYTIQYLFNYVLYYTYDFVSELKHISDVCTIEFCNLLVIFSWQSPSCGFAWLLKLYDPYSNRIHKWEIRNSRLLLS